ncbi:tyrosine phosphatase family-domain-containing protein [Podospora conica]|nr:tyrosine phosphatase family-domain-containing protein [Schizothecium conicum]
MGGQQNKQADAFGSVQGHTAFSNPDPQAPLGADGQPDNFGVIVPGMYRSSFPQAEDYAFLEKLKLKTIVTLVQKDFSDHFFDFVTRNGINHHVVDMKGTKKEEIPAHQMSSILEFVLDKKHHPLLIHCKQGRHRTGCVVGAVRKATGWNLGHILDEYKNYAHPKPRDCDIAYLTGFQPGVFPQWGRGDAADFPGFVANRGSRYRDLLDLIDVSKFHELSGRRRVTLIMTLIILMVIIMAIFDPYPPCFNKRCN